MTKTAIESFPVSDNVAKMRASTTLAAMQAAQAMRAEGVDVVDLGAGEPDFDTPDNIKRAAAEAMNKGKTKYTPTAGTRQLQQAIIDYYERGFGAHFDRSEVMATSGGKQAILRFPKLQSLRGLLPSSSKPRRAIFCSQPNRSSVPSRRAPRSSS
jgi:aspartate/methionine/tyrosine aminotransferase